MKYKITATCKGKELALEIYKVLKNYTRFNDKNIGLYLYRIGKKKLKGGKAR